MPPRKNENWFQRNGAALMASALGACATLIFNDLRGDVAETKKLVAEFVKTVAVQEQRLADADRRMTKVEAVVFPWNALPQRLPRDGRSVP